MKGRNKKIESQRTAIFVLLLTGCLAAGCHERMSLQRAIQQDRVDIVLEYLAEAEPDCLLLADGRTPLLAAAESGKLKTTAALVAMDAALLPDTDAPPIQTAVYLGRPEVLANMTRAADLYELDIRYQVMGALSLLWSKLDRTADADNRASWEMIEYLLDTLQPDPFAWAVVPPVPLGKPFDPSRVANDAVSAGRSSIVRKLVHLQWLSPTDSNSARPIYGAIHAGDLELVRFFLSRGAKPMPPPEVRSAMSYLELAAFVEHPDIASLLIKHGAEVSLASALGLNRTADIKRHLQTDTLPEDPPHAPWLVWAVIGNDSGWTDKLLDLGADPDERKTGDPTGTAFFWSPFQWACLRKNQTLAMLMLNRGADPDLPSLHHSGITALQLAAANGMVKLVGEMLRRGADPTLEDDWGNTAMDYASKAGQNEVFQRLQQHTQVGQ